MIGAVLLAPQSSLCSSIEASEGGSHLTATTPVGDCVALTCLSHAKLLTNIIII